MAGASSSLSREVGGLSRPYRRSLQNRVACGELNVEEWLQAAPTVS